MVQNGPRRGGGAPWRGQGAEQEGAVAERRVVR